MNDERELIEKAKNGDRRSFNELIKIYQKMVSKMAFSFTKNYDDADEIVQETFLKVYLKLKTFKEESKFKTWLYAIALNTARNYYKKNFRKDNVFLDEVKNKRIYYKESENIKRSDLKDFIYSFINTLPKKQREVFLLKFENDLKFKEISEICKISQSAAKTHFQRAIEKLRKFLIKKGYYNEL